VLDSSITIFISPSLVFDLDNAAERVLAVNYAEAEDFDVV